MADPLFHLALSLFVVNELNVSYVYAFAGLLPDVDVFLPIPHRTLLHSPLFYLPLLLGNRDEKTIGFLAILHIIVDLFFMPVKPLWPLPFEIGFVVPITLYYSPYAFALLISFILLLLFKRFFWR